MRMLALLCIMGFGAVLCFASWLIPWLAVGLMFLVFGAMALAPFCQEIQSDEQRDRDRHDGIGK